jgi:hypothetical protein
MDDLIQAIASNDFVKVKQCFNEAMEQRKESVIAEQRKLIASSVMIEGEVVVEAEDDVDDDGKTKDEDDETRTSNDYCRKPSCF